MKKIILTGVLLCLIAGSSLISAQKDGAKCTRPATSFEPANTNAEIFNEEACDPYSLSVMAYVWGKPFVDSAKIRVFFTQPNDPLAARPASVAAAALNRFGHGRVLADPLNKSGVGPNNDTLYSNVSFDLTTGPFVVSTPDFSDRYYTFSVAHPDSTTTQFYGSRTHGAKLPPLFVHSDDYQGAIPAGMIAITSEHRYLHLWGRMLVRSKDDLKNVRELQDAMKIERFYQDGTLEPVGLPPEQRPWPAGTDARGFLRQLSTAIADMGLSPQDQIMADCLAPLLEAAQLKKWPKEIDGTHIEQGIMDAKSIVERSAKNFGTKIGGWSVNRSGPRFGTDWLLRAAVAKDQIYVTIPEEAIYPIARTSADGTILDCQKQYRITFDTLPPVQFFWSITLYDDKGAMVANPINRYSVGSRNGDLRGHEGILRDIIITSSKPNEGGVIWLPSPEGAFYMMMRLYGPNKEIQNGEWQPPAIIAIP